MTRDELKAAIAEFTGLRVDDSDEVMRELKLYSPNGRLVCTMSISNPYGDGWQFGGVSGAFPYEWQALCRMGEVQS